MRIVVTEDGIPLGSVFKLVATGYAVGVGVVFLPVTTLAALGMLIFMEGPKQFELLLAPLMVVVIVAGQALIIGLIVVFGLAVFRMFGGVQVDREGGG